MAEACLGKKRRQRRGKKKPKEQREHNGALQNILNELPFGPIQFSKSHMYEQIRHNSVVTNSVNSPAYPLMKPPFDIRMTAVLVRHNWQWATKCYELERGLILRVSHIPMGYYYDLVNQYYCTPLRTKCVIEIVTITLNSDNLFSTHMTLAKRGVAAVKDCYRECVACRKLYTDLKHILYAVYFIHDTHKALTPVQSQNSIGVLTSTFHLLVSLSRLYRLRRRRGSRRSRKTSSPVLPPSSLMFQFPFMSAG